MIVWAAWRDEEYEYDNPVAYFLNQEDAEKCVVALKKKQTEQTLDYVERLRNDPEWEYQFDNKEELEDFIKHTIDDDSLYNYVAYPIEINDSFEEWEKKIAN